MNGVPVRTFTYQMYFISTMQDTLPLSPTTEPTLLLFYNNSWQQDIFNTAVTHPNEPVYSVDPE